MKKLFFSFMVFIHIVSQAAGQITTESPTMSLILGIFSYQSGRQDWGRKFFDDAKKRAENGMLEKARKINLQEAKLQYFLGLSDAETLNLKVNTKGFRSLEAFHQYISAKRSLQYALFLRAVGNYCRAFGEYKKTDSLYNKSEKIYLEKFKRGHVAHARLMNDRAKLFFEQGDYKKSRLLFEEAQKVIGASLGKNNIEYAMSLNSLANLYLVLGLYDQGIEYCTKARDIIAKSDFRQAIVSSTLAKLYSQKGLYNEAKTMLLKSLEIIETALGKDVASYAIISTELAKIYEKQGNYKKAEARYIEAKSIFYMIGGTRIPGYATLQFNLAGFNHLQGNYDKAELMYLDAQKIWERKLGKHHLLYTTLLYELSDLYQKTGQLKKSEALIKQAKAVLTTVLGTKHPQYARILMGLAKVFHNQGLFQKAKLFLKEALQITKDYKGKNTLLYSDILNELALNFREQKSFTQAAKLCIEGLQIIKELIGKENPKYHALLVNLASNYQDSKHKQEAEEAFVEAMQIAENIFEKSHLKYIESLNSFAKFQWVQGKYHKADSLFQRAFLCMQLQIRQSLSVLNESEKLDFFKANIGDKYQVYNDFAVDFLNKMGLHESRAALIQMLNNRLLTKALFFYSSKKVKERIYSDKDLSLVKKYEKFITKRKLYNQMLESSVRSNKNLIDLKQLATEIDSLERVIGKNSIVFFQNLKEFQTLDWREVQKKLSSQEVAIEIIRFVKGKERIINYIALLIVPGNNHPIPVFFENGKLMEGQGYANYLKIIKFKSKDIWSYKLFWEPIQHKLKVVNPHTKKVYISLDGVFNKINLETLWNPKTAHYLSEELSIRLVSNIKTLTFHEKTQNQVPNPTIFLFGAPNYRFYNDPDKKSINDISLTSLSGTKKEVLSIQKILSSKFYPKLFIDSTATEENIKALRNPTLLHFATHGFFKRKPTYQNDEKRKIDNPVYQYPLLRVGLYFTGAEASINNKVLPPTAKDNGILTAREVLDLDLQETNLVVLSACETGRGEVQNGEGVYGLQRAFLSAGAKNVLMSLWKIDDIVTQYFMGYFYESWLKKQDVRSAYRYARERLKQDYPSPYYWGAFVLVNE